MLAHTQARAVCVITNLNAEISRINGDSDNIKLHLGCGETLLSGYVNIDYPKDQHNIMNVSPDLAADLTMLACRENSVDEIRSHHVFEHFNRIAALGMLIRWRSWLKPGGLLIIETPDFLATARAALELGASEQIALARHLEGDQAAQWGFHFGQWFPGRFKRTLSLLGYEIDSIESARSPWHRLPLHNVTVLARKPMQTAGMDIDAAAEQLLRDSLVAEEEVDKLAVWTDQLQRFLSFQDIYDA